MSWPSSNPSGAGEHDGITTRAHTGGHGTEDPVKMAYFAQRQVLTERLMRYYAAAICGLIAVFVIFHWTHWACVKVERARGPSGLLLARPFVISTRMVRNLLVRKVPGFKSAGHALVTVAYVAINASIAFTNVDLSSMGGVAHRFGWLTLVNLSVVVFLALKNTPLAFLTAYSYERLNCLHQIAGCSMFIMMVIHASLYTAFFASENRLGAIYSRGSVIGGIVAGFGFLSVILSALILRRIWYELFYVTHITSWALSIVALGIHRPEIANKTLIIVLIAASMWFVDRVIRACRVLYYSTNNEARLYSLPDGSTKVVFKKVPSRARPGKHCFVWIPAIRKFETHPFTIHGSSPVEFTVKARNGFTSDLHKYAVAHPGEAVTASIDGPYGTFPDPMKFDKIVLIAGGGGATFTIGLAINVLERMDESSPKDVVFIWSVRKHENLSWFSEQLELLRTHVHSPKISVSLYVTRPASPTSDFPSGSESECSEQTKRYNTFSKDAESPPLSPVGSDPEKDVHRTTAPAAHPPSSRTHSNSETEKERVAVAQVEHCSLAERESLKAIDAGTCALSEYPIKIGRPDAASVIRDAVKTTPRNRRVLVAACGPDGLMRVVRDTTAGLIVSDGPAVELHCEEFGW